MCMLVAGVPRSEGAFIGERILTIARAAKVPIARPHCVPDFFIDLTADPEGLLRRWSNGRVGWRLFVFCDEDIDVGYSGMCQPQPLNVQAFIETPRTVRVWYDTEPPQTTVRGPQASPQPMPDLGPSLLRVLPWSMSRVFVIVDKKRLHGVTDEQLADYIAVVGLVKLKPSSVGITPTILKLFDGSPQTAPTGLTNWDEAFLKSVYSTDPASKLQRGQIALEMVGDVGP